jgi:hypothetical protein
VELPAENKRTALLALAVLGALLVIVLTVSVVFGEDDEGTDAGGATPTAAAGGGQGGGPPAGSGTGSGASTPSGGATPLVGLDEVAAAHTVMARYMAGINTYDHTSRPAAWSAPLLALTSGDSGMKRVTALPTGQEWAACRAERCASKGTAVVVRDAVISDDVVRGSGRTISSVVKVTTTRTGGGNSATEANQWLVTVKEDGGQWLVTGFDVFGLGDVGASETSGE